MNSPDAMEPRIVHRDRSPVFVVGHARSGTSITTRMIRKHLRIAFGTESQFIVRRAALVARSGDLRDEAARRRFLSTLSQERFFARTKKNYGFSLDLEAAVERSAGGAYRDVLDSVFSQLASHMGFARWGDKTPEYALHLPILHQIFPEARFVNVVRDGRDVALSIFETQFGAKNAYVAARDWSASLSAVETFRIDQPTARVLDVRYEDLLSDPSNVFTALVRFLDVEDEDGGLGERVGSLVRKEIRPGNCGKWSRGMSAAEQQLFEAAAGQWLDRYRYERSGGRLPRLSPLTSAFWRADDLARRLGRAGYWRDSIYRLGLRLGSAGGPLLRFGQRASSDGRHDH